MASRRALMVGGLALLTLLGALVLTRAMFPAPKTGLWGDHAFTPTEAYAMPSPYEDFVVLILEAPLPESSLKPFNTGVVIVGVPIELIRNGVGGSFGAYEHFFVRGSHELNGSSQVRLSESAASGSVTVSHLRNDGFDLEWSVITESGETSFGRVFVVWNTGA